MCPPHPTIWAQSLLETNFPEDVKVKGCGMEDWLKDRERGFQQKLTGVGQSCSEEALTLNLAGSKVLLNSHEHLRPGVPGTTATLHTPSQHTPDSSWSTGVSRPGWACRQRAPTHLSKYWSNGGFSSLPEVVKRHARLREGRQRHGEGRKLPAVATWQGPPHCGAPPQPHQGP